jgi:hypothetical protein
MTRINVRRALGPCAALVVASSVVIAQTLAVRHDEGLVHGFLVLRTTAGAHLADGELLQTSQGNRVTSRLIFHFKDGSLQEETSVFSQDRTFQFIGYHLVQKGHAFPRALDMTIDRGKGAVTVRYTDDDGEEQVAEDHMDLPANLANGLMPVLLKNARPADLPLTLSMIAATPKPRMVKLIVTSAGTDPFTTGGTSHQAIHYVVKAELGGLAGLLAPLAGKQPPDSHVWILGGDAPAFVKAEYPFFAQGPLWRIELTSPVWK